MHAALLLVALAAAPPGARAPRIASHRIEARLDPATGRLDGREWLTWENASPEPQREIWLHAYWNAFRNERSAFYSESRWQGAFREGFPARRDEDWGSMEIESVRVEGEEIAGTLRFRHPDGEGTPGDETVFTLALPRAVPPGGRVTLEIAWKGRTPRLVARAGRWGPFFMMGQWYPKPCVLEAPGVRGAPRTRWSCHAHHGFTEFYADFGGYDVSLTVPDAVKVGATGEPVERRPNGDGSTTWRFRQEDVHDFAWTAWDGYEVVEEAFREPGLPEVKLVLLLHPEHRRAAPQYLAAARAALRRFGAWWGPYPHSRLTLVDPPLQAMEAGGMEYAGLVALGSGRHPVEPRDYLVWGVTAHEIAHQWFQGMVASNEVEEAWLDEGLTSWTAGRMLAAEGVPIGVELAVPHRLRALAAEVIPLRVEQDAILRLILRGDPQTPIATPGWQFRSFGDYGAASYSRAELALRTLERLLGAETMERGVRGYVDRWRFRHPSGADFVASLNEASGQDWTWFFDTFFRGTERLDYGLAPIRCIEDRPDGLGLGARPEEASAKAAGGPAKGEAGPWACRVVVERIGGARVPVDVRITFSDGRVEHRRWERSAQGATRWWRLELAGTSRVERVEIDPDHLWLLDENRANDSVTRQPDRLVSGRLLAWIASLAEVLLIVLPSLV